MSYFPQKYKIYKQNKPIPPPPSYILCDVKNDNIPIATSNNNH